MTDPREFNEQASTPQPDGAEQIEQIEQIEELDARVDDDDQVKGGRRRAGDPCDGGEISSKLG